MRSFLRGLTECNIPLKYGVLNARARETWNPSLGGGLWERRGQVGWHPESPSVLRPGSMRARARRRRKVSLEGIRWHSVRGPHPQERSLSSHRTRPQFRGLGPLDRPAPCAWISPGAAGVSRMLGAFRSGCALAQSGAGRPAPTRLSEKEGVLVSPPRGVDKMVLGRSQEDVCSKCWASCLAGGYSWV